MTSTLSSRDWEALSAYLDDQLKPRERVRLEARLAAEPALQAGLRELDQTRTMLRSVPPVRAPRNFTLSPEMAVVRQPFLLRLYPVFQSAAVVATVLFALVFALSSTRFVSITRSFEPADEPVAMQAAEDAPEPLFFAAEAPPEEEVEVAEADSVMEDPEQEKSIAAGEVEMEEVMPAEEIAPMAAVEGDLATPDLTSRVTSDATETMEEAAEEGARVAPEVPLVEAVEEPTLTPSPTPTLTPTLTPEPTATLPPTLIPTPTPTPTFEEMIFPIRVSTAALWLLGGIALGAIAMTVFVRSRQP
jgi:anti-sigma factor RsiW